MTATERFAALLRRYPVRVWLAGLIFSVLAAYSIHSLVHDRHFFDIRAALVATDTPKFLELWQALIVVLTLSAIIAGIVEREKASYTEANKRYEQFSLLLFREDAPLLGFDRAEVERYVATGGTRKDLLLYEMLFSLCEYAYALYRKRPGEWKRWERWLSNFFVNDGRAIDAWYVTSQYYEKEFRERIETGIVAAEADARAKKRFPGPEEWTKANPANGGLETRRVPEGEELLVYGFQVMQSWEEPYMEAMAAAVTRPAGTVLEIGYGLGISSRHVQRLRPSKHVIIEANEHLAKRARRDLISEMSRAIAFVYTGFWEDLVPKSPWRDDAGVEHFDGILFDTYPLKKDELRKNHFPFFPAAASLLAPGGTFTYFSDEVETISYQHQMAIQHAFGDADVHVKPVRVEPWSSCEYWKSQRILLVTITTPHR